MRDPKEAAKLIEESSESDPKSTRGETEAQLKATLPLLSEDGRLDSGRTADFLDWMHERGWLESAMPASELLADEQPPGA